MIQPNKGSIRNRVVASEYDDQFDGPEVGQDILSADQAREGNFGTLSLDYNKTLKEGGVDYVPGMDINAQLAAHQTGGEQVWRVLKRGGVGILGAAAEPFAFAMDLEHHINTLRGVEQTYDNTFAAMLRGMEDSVREANPIYTKDEHPDIMSADWWAANSDQMIRSIGYLLPGSQMFKAGSYASKIALTRAANVLGKSAQGIATASNIGGAVSSAIILNYGEHAVSAVKHIEDAVPRLRKHFISEGMDPKQADERAKQQAYEEAEGIVWGGKVNVLWQSMSQLNLFRGISHSRSMGKINSSAKAVGIKDLVRRIGVEMPTEYMEEVTTGYLEKEARYKTDRELGLRLDDHRPANEKWFDHISTYEGVTEGLTGAFGAMPMGGITSFTQRKQRIEALEQVKAMEVALGADGSKVTDITEDQFFEHAAMNAYKGTFQNFIEAIEGYANMSKEEAAKLGVEENYQEIGKQYIKDAHAVEKAFNALLENPISKSPGALDILFNNKLNAYKNEKNIRRYKQELDEALADERQLNEDIANKPEEIGLHSLRNIGISIASYQNIVIKLEKQLKDFKQSLKDSPLLVSVESNERESNIRDTLKEAKKRLQELSESKSTKMKEEILLKGLSESEIVALVSGLESTGELGIKIAVLTESLELARLRRKSSSEAYDNYVKHPALLEAEGKKIVDESNAKAEKKKASEKKSKKDEKKTLKEKAVSALQKASDLIANTIAPEAEVSILEKIKSITTLKELEAYEAQLKADKKSSPAIFKAIGRKKLLINNVEGANRSVAPDGNLQTPATEEETLAKVKEGKEDPNFDPFFEKLGELGNLSTEEQAVAKAKKIIEEIRALTLDPRFAADAARKEHWQTLLFETKIKQLIGLIEKGINTSEDVDALTKTLNAMRGAFNTGIGTNARELQQESQALFTEIANTLKPHISESIIKEYIQNTIKAMKGSGMQVKDMLLSYPNGTFGFDGKNQEYFITKALFDAAAGVKQTPEGVKEPQESASNRLDAISDLVGEATSDNNTNKSEYPVNLPSGGIMATRTSTSIDIAFPKDKFTGTGFELNTEWGNLVDKAVESIISEFERFSVGKSTKEDMHRAATTATDMYMESGKMTVEAAIQKEAIASAVDAVYALMENNPNAIFKTQLKAFKTVGGKTVAGALDIVIVKENGHVDIIDVKASVTSTQVGAYNDGSLSASKKTKHTRQQSMYKAMLEANGITVDAIKIMPFKVKEDQNHIIDLVAEPLITLNYDQSVVSEVFKANQPSEDTAHLSPVLDGDISNGGSKFTTSEINKENSEVIPNRAIEVFEDNGEGKSHQLVSSQSAGFVSVEYQTVDVVVEDGKVVQKKLSESNSINENSLDLHSTRSLRSGDPVNMKLVGPNGDITKEELRNMSDEDIAKLPIIISGVVNGVETKLTALHSVEWVSNNNSESTREVEIQKAINLRLHLAKADNNTELTSVIYKGSGLILQMFEEDENGKLVVRNSKIISQNNPVKESLPNWSNLEIGVSHGGEIHTKEGVVTNKELAADFLISDGRVVALLPTPNGTYFPTILWADKISAEQAATVIGAAVSFITANEDTYSLITDKTGIDFGREGAKNSLHAFINRYVYASSYSYKYEAERESTFDKGHILVYAPVYKGSDRANSNLQIVDVDNRAIYTSDPAFYFKDDTAEADEHGLYRGELKDEHVENGIEAIYSLNYQASAERAAELLQRKLMSVSTKRINSKETFTDVPLNADGSAVLTPQGEPATTTYPSYNSYKGNGLTTDINGSNKIEHTDGTTEYIYMTQPLVLVGMDFLEEIENAEDATAGEAEIEFFSPAIEGVSEKTEEESLISDALTAELTEDLIDGTQMSAELQDQFIQGIFHQYARMMTAGISFSAISTALKAHIAKQVAGYKKKGSKKLLAYEAILKGFSRSEGNVTIEGIILEKLKALDIVPTKEGFTSEGLSAIEFNNLLDSSEDLTQDAYDSEFYKADRKKTAAAEVKLFLSSLSDPRSKNWAGMSVGINYQDVYDTLKSLMTNVPGGLNEKLQEVLNASPNPLYKDIVGKIKGLPLDLQSKFMIAMSGTKLNFVQVLIDSSNPTKTKVLNADNYGTISNVLEKWLNALKAGEMTKTLKGETVISNTKINQVKARYAAHLAIAVDNRKDKNLNITSDKFLAQLQGVLRELGMEVPMGGLRHISQGGKALSAYTNGTSHWEAALSVKSRTGFMAYIFNAFEHELLAGSNQFLAGELDVNPEHEAAIRELAENTKSEHENKGLFYMNNPIEGKNVEKSVRGLARLTVDYNGVIFGNNFRGADGKSIYPYQNEFGMQRLLEEYKSNPRGENSLDQLLGLSFTRGSSWGHKLLEANKKFVLEIAMLDATKMINSGVKPAERKNQGKFMQQVTSLNLFTNQGGEVAYFFPLTIGDKDITPLLKASKWKNIDGETALSQTTIKDGKVVNIGDKILNDIVEYAMGEYDRIHNHKTREGVDRGAYEEGAKYFYRFDYLNSYNGEEDAIWEEGGTELKIGVDKEDIKTHITAKVKESILAEIQKSIDIVTDLNISTSYIDGKYKELVKKESKIDTKNPADLMAAALADRELNYVISNNEQMILFGNDPAHAYKKNKGPFNLQATVKSTLNNYEKRKADLLSPSTSPEYTSKTVNIVTAFDSEVTIDGRDVERTDGQEYGTILEALEMKGVHGKLPSAIKNKIKDAITEAIEDKNNLLNEYYLADILTDAEYARVKDVFVTDKPSHVTNDIQEGQDSNNKVFRKSSTRWLWPAETVGHDIDNLRVAMENLGIERLGHTSSDKTGAVNVATIYDSKGEFLSSEEIEANITTTKSIRPVSRKGLGWQQEKPVNKDKVSQSTQLDVLVFDDMGNVTLSSGKKVSELRTQKEAIVSQFYKLGLKTLFGRMGITADAAGNVSNIDMGKISDFLKAEAVSRGWAKKDIRELSVEDTVASNIIERTLKGLIGEEMQFKSPLMFNNARTNIEALVLSLIRKEVANIKLPGYGYIQASGAGFRAKGGMTWSEYSATLENKKGANNVITYVDPQDSNNGFDETKGLQGPRVTAGGEVLPGQILVKPHFKLGNIDIDLTNRKYTRVRNGKRYLKLDTVPRELLQMIGYRVPGQGKSSVMALEVVGFLPSTSVATAIIPDEMLAQMGSDFDIDVLYTYRKQYIVTAGGRIEKKTDLSELESLQDQYFEVLKELIFDAEYVSSTEPLDNTDIREAADIVDELKGVSNQIDSPSYVNTNIAHNLSQRTGKNLIAPASLAATLYASVQDRGIKVAPDGEGNPRPFIFFETSEGKIELDNISSVGKSVGIDITTERTSSYNNRSVQNAAVDNANEQVLDRAGINDATIDVALFALQYKDVHGHAVPMDQVIYFLRQEAIEMYNDKFDYYSSGAEGGYLGYDQIRDKSFNAVMNELNAKIHGGVQELDHTSIGIYEYRLDENGEYVTFTSEALKEQFGAEKNDVYYENQKYILAAFRDLQVKGDPVKKLQRAIMSPRTKGLGSTIFDAQRVLENMETVFNGDLKGLIGVTEALAGTQFETLYESLRSAYKAFGQALPFDVASHKGMLSMYREWTGNDDVSPYIREALFTAMLEKGYATAFESTFDINLEETRAELLFSEENSISAEVQELQKTEWGQRNLFIQRLLPVIKSSLTVPNTLSYTASKQEDVKDQMHNDLVALYQSDVQGHRALFERIVKYAYVMGGHKNARSFVQFIPAAYLEKTGFYSALRGEQRRISSTEGTFNTYVATKEWLQHNPKNATVLQDKDLVVSQFLEESLADSKVNFNGKNQLYQVVLKPVGAASLPYFKYTYENNGVEVYRPFLAIKSGSRTQLFEKSPYRTESGGIIFNRIPLKGKFTNKARISEYSGVNGEEIGTVFAENEVPTASYAESVRILGLPELPVAKVEVATPDEATPYGIREGMSLDREGARNLLDKVSKESSNVAYRVFASILKKNFDTVGADIMKVIEAKTSTKNGKVITIRGAYTDGTVKLNSDLLSKPETAEEVILHEFLHGFLSKEVENKGSELYTVLNRLKAASKKLLAEKVRSGEVDKDSLDYALLEYAFSSPHEFMTHAMTSKKVQLFLNEQRGNKTIWGQLKAAIFRFMQSLGEALGVKINQDSALVEAIDVILRSVNSESLQKAKVTAKSAQASATVAMGVIQEDGTFDTTHMGVNLHRAAANALVTKGAYTADQVKEAITKTVAKDTQSKNSEHFSPAVIKTIDTAQKFIESNTERINRLKSKLTQKNLTEAEGQRIRERLSSYARQRKSLKDNKNLGGLQAVATVQLAWVKGVLSNKTATNVEIQEALNIVDSYNYDITSEYLDPSDLNDTNVWNRALLDLSRRSSSLKARILDKLLEGIAAEINTSMPIYSLSKSDLTEIAEEKFMMLKAYTQDLTKFKAPLVKLINKMLKKAARAKDTKIDALFEEIDAAWDEVKSHPALMADPNLFMQKDEAGNPSGYFVNRYSDSWRLRRNKLFSNYFKTLKKIDDTPAATDRAKKAQIIKRKTAHNVLMNNLNNIEIAIDIRFWKNEKGEEVSTVLNSEKLEGKPKNREEYIALLDKELGVDVREELVASALKQFDRYMIEKSAHGSIIVADLDGASSQEVEAVLDRWQAEHSPLSSLNARYGVQRSGGRQLGHNRLITAPRKTHKTTKKALNYYDKSFIQIKNDTALNSFYEFYTEEMQNLMRTLPDDVVSQLPENFFPAAQRAFVERLQNEGLTGAWESMKEFKFKSLVSLSGRAELNPLVVSEGSREADTGKPIKSIPVRMIKGVDAENKSYDIKKVMKMFGAMAVNFEFKSEVEDRVLLLQRALREAKHLQLDAQGKPIKLHDKKTNLSVRGGLNTTREAVDYAIDASLYGFTTDVEEDYHVINRKATKIQEDLKGLEVKLANNEITQSEFNVEKVKLETEYEKIDPTKFSAGVAVDNLIKFTQVKGMGWNIGAGLNNVGFGTIANYVHAAGGEDFSTAQLAKAYWMVMQSSASSIAGGTKIGRLAKKYGILFEQLDAQYGKEVRTEFNMLSALSPYEIQRRTEFVNQIAPFIAKMLNTEINASGTTLFEAYDDKGNFKAEYAAEAEEWTSVLEATTSNKFTMFRDSTIELNKVNHGNYDPNSAILLKKSTLGRAGLMFRTWMLEGFNTRWAAHDYNEQLDRYTKGRWTSYGTVGAKGSVLFLVKGLINQLTLNSAISNGSMQGEMSELDYINMKKNLSELKAAIMLWGASMLLSALAEGEDDDEALGLYRLMANVTHRLLQDIAFYASPATAMEILKNPTPLVKTLGDFMTAFKATYKYHTQDNYLGDPLLKKWSKTIPIGSPIYSLNYALTEDVNK